MNAEHYVYRLFDARNQLLYVGCSSNLTQRFASHGRIQVWWSEVAHHTVTGPYDRKAGRWIEMLAIRREHPLYNIQHNETPSQPPAQPSQDVVADAAWRIGVQAVRIREAIARGELPAENITDAALMAWVMRWPTHPIRKSA